jgi:hypothetical protein
MEHIVGTVIVEELLAWISDVTSQIWARGQRSVGALGELAIFCFIEDKLTK